jgi:hypothetical protein
LAIQLRRDIKPTLDQQGVKLFLVSIGTLERSRDFAGVTGFPSDCLFADPDSASYKALGLVKGVKQTFFSYDVSGVVIPTRACTWGEREGRRALLIYPGGWQEGSDTAGWLTTARPE